MSQDTTLAATRPLPFVKRLIGVVFSPGETMANVAAFPRWLDMLALTSVVMAVGFYVFLSTDVGKAAFVDQGVPVILISHTLPDVFAVTDRIVVMHRGRKVAEKATASTNSTEIVEYMVGARDDLRAAE